MFLLGVEIRSVSHPDLNGTRGRKRLLIRVARGGRCWCWSLRRPSPRALSHKRGERIARMNLFGACGRGRLGVSAVAGAGCLDGDEGAGLVPLCFGEDLGAVYEEVSGGV